ncbi:MAG: SPOR domain-containing protein [Pseudodesulfovibrio sp.]|uniref:Sporulation domain-containing protein n=1 Tax=Pseudodesulfovibrio aespoeensis (strain ATCC 700646 / DSM 10631 / Aspo-2) TaxID=643562 RepID=E6VR69_PSEA9|nr:MULTISPECIES: SPOR domain-containing protein [Pseudodesulfovibrio]MBU4245179.1 SPOR domain-containing protein [Pseudomonadota bacterium]ADU64153.1 Sporulation domain-containing protein [Pseudodesulfovibrio aespoeensis Aspo-2]MBU4378779.1 SPOR domain-containing protein [Pseudomonadota bacterium]MBU4475473.1 SPOR domain-containing protein [Pseudomonadota bacterium]MBU4517611.1 SPOR domain-containing protein [Pseudomonadota bacterium]
MKIHGKSGLLIAAAYLIATLALGGCARQHIVSSPPAQRPADRAMPTPAPGPAETAETAGATASRSADEQWQGSEGVSVVDAPATGESKAVFEDDLDEEPGWVKATSPATTAPPEAAQPAAAASASTEPAQSAAIAPDAATVAMTQGGKYYVQVGAFSDLENANRALARLIKEGYKGSKLDATADGIYRVQAGAFADPVEAGAALDQLRAEYPKGFVLKTD